MKLDLNNIDDVFKDGLKDYTEQPSPGSWKKISARMLWNDLIHLRFGNIPRAWLGAAAGFVVVAIMLSLWLGSGDQTPEKRSGNQATTASEQSVAKNDPSRQPDEIGATQHNSISGKTEYKDTGSRNNAGNGPEIAETNDRKNQAMAGQPTTTPTNTEESAPSTTGQPESQENQEAHQSVNQDKNKVIYDDNSSNESGTDAASKVAAAVAINDLHGTVDKPEPETPAKTPSTSSNVSATSGDPNNLKTKPEPGQGIEIVDPSTNINRENTFPRYAKQQSFTGSSRTENFTAPLRKMPTVNAVSFSTGQSLQDSRRLTTRAFSGDPDLIRRGYKPYFTVSAYFAPGITDYHRPASESKETSYTGGFALSYNTENYLIQAGVEISTTNDLGDYMVNINSYDSIGFYNGVSGFEIDPENPDQLIFQTHTVEVWDTVKHHSHQQTNNRYTYLQVPLMVGYKALETGLFSAHIKAGPSFSFLLTGREPGLDFRTPGNARITGIDNFTAPRLQTNVQILVSVALQMQLTERFGVLMEPTYRYYLNAVYDVNGESLKNPYGIGVKGGVFFNF